MDVMDRARGAIMRLHTPEQRRGIVKLPTRPGYIRYMNESREMHLALERISRDTVWWVPHKYEKAAALESDITHMSCAWEIEPSPALEADCTCGPGATYARYLSRLPAHIFLAHWYCVHFAHMAGGRRIADGMGLLGEYHTPSPGDPSQEEIRRALVGDIEQWPDPHHDDFVNAMQPAYDHLMALSESMFLID